MSSSPALHILRGQHLFLLPEKAIFWKEEQVLILADLHLGKVPHFRKAGIAIPSMAGYQNFHTLSQLLKNNPARRMLFLGDLFHSAVNSDWQVFEEWMAAWPDVEMILVKGNHDILPASFYNNSRMEVHESYYHLKEFSFTHIPLPAEELSDSHYNFSGHIHPGVKLAGKGRQSITLPCYLFGSQQALLPAFGSFTGLGIVQPQPDDKVFVLAGEKVMEVK